jgi:hypothetical protein
MKSGLWVDFLQNSFAVAVAAFLLFRMEERLDGLTNAIVHLGSSVETLVRHLVCPADSAAQAAQAENAAWEGKDDGEGA